MPVLSRFGRRSRLNLMIPALALALLALGCRSESPGPSGQVPVEATVIDHYQKVVSLDDEILAHPHMVEYEPVFGHTFVYDHEYKSVLELDSGGARLRTFGGEGRGPGELSGVTSFTVTDDRLYINDHIQYLFHRYDRSGEPLSSLLYGATETTENRPGPPRLPVKYEMNNEPFFTLDGSILRPVHENGEILFARMDWEERHLAGIGEIPPAYGEETDNEAYHTALENGEVPPYDLARAFPVNDRSNPGELYIVYSAIPKIAKYDTSGNLIWENEVPHTPEFDSLADTHARFMAHYPPDYRYPLRKYIWGRSGPDGSLYLATYTNLNKPPEEFLQPLWIHRFGPEGELLQRFRLVTAEGFDLLPFFALDPENSRFLVLPHLGGELWAYPF